MRYIKPNGELTADLPKDAHESYVARGYHAATGSEVAALQQVKSNGTLGTFLLDLFAVPSPVVEEESETQKENDREECKYCGFFYSSGRGMTRHKKARHPAELKDEIEREEAEERRQETAPPEEKTEDAPE